MRFDDEQFSGQGEVDPGAAFESLGEGLESETFGFETDSPSPSAMPRTGFAPGSRPPARPVAARILWPALGFPAVIAPRPGASRDPADSDATKTICVLVVSNVQTLTSHDAARYLRYVRWANRRVRTIKAGEPGSFSPLELTVRNGLVESGPEDTHGKALSFGGNRQQRNGVTASLSKYVRNFYRNPANPAIGLRFLHEIRVSEEASARLADGQYHLLWNKEGPDQSPHSDEMKLLLDRFVPGRLHAVGPASQDHSLLLNGYQFAYGGLHQPYNRQEPTEVLHPLFVRRNLKNSVAIGHVTDTHIDVRNDVYARNLRRRSAQAEVCKATKGKPVQFNNWNDSFTAVYSAAKNSDLILLTGDLIDYGRGHIGTADDKLGQDNRYHKDRNWFLFYSLLASEDRYRTPVYTILGNHDWRINPYPPFAPSTPDPEEFLHNGNVFTRGEREVLLQIAHGPGHQRAYSYLLDVDRWLFQKAEAAARAPVRDSWAALRGQLDFPNSPVYTTDDSIRWYLLVINPFLDYQFAWPAGHQFLMLDFAEDEELGKEDSANGAVKSYGPRASKCLTTLQQWHVEQFVRLPGRAKTIGIHVPPIGPRPNWFQSDLLEGKKTHRGDEDRRYPTPDFHARQFNEYPLLAVRPGPAPFGFAADYGSFVGKGSGGTDTREWFIRRVATAGAGVRAVLSGHIHRQGLFVVFPGVIRLSGWNERFGTIPVLRVRRMPEQQAGRAGVSGPLYVNTTSAGPRGYQYFGVKQTRSEDPGFSLVELSNDGTINKVRHVPVRDVSARPTVACLQA